MDEELPVQKPAERREPHNPKRLWGHFFREPPTGGRTDLLLPYRVVKVMGKEIQTGTRLSRFNAGVNSMMLATLMAASSRAFWPED